MQNHLPGSTVTGKTICTSMSFWMRPKWGAQIGGTVLSFTTSISAPRLHKGLFPNVAVTFPGLS